MAFKVIAIDFDGTLCENKWPEIGAPNEELFLYLRTRQQLEGAKLILWTCREGVQLTEAVDWCKKRGLIFDAVNENLPERIAMFGTDPRKISADEYIDDRMSTRFKLPFVKRETGINDDIINKVECTFGFPLYDWQKRYLKGEDNAIPIGGRRKGKTFAYCIRLLLGNHEPFDLHKPYEVDKLVDENHGPYYTSYFRSYLRNLNDQLLSAGFNTNAEKKNHSEEVFKKGFFYF